MKTNFKDIDDYISQQPKNVACILTEIRQTIKDIAPEAQETISYQMPAFKYFGVLVYFAAFKNHIGLYALPSGNLAFQKELASYKTGKGSIQFPIDKPIPFDLIRKIVQFRMEENRNKIKK